MKKILIGYLIDGKNGGIDKYLMSILDILIQSGVHIDFLTKKIDPELYEFLGEKNVGLYDIPSLKHPLKQYKSMRKLIRKNKYDAVYFNISEAFNCIGILAAFHEHVKNIMVHSHSSNCAEPKRIKRHIKLICHKICKQLVVCKKATDYFACSLTAANWMYTPSIITSSKFEFIYNAVDRKNYIYSKEVRDRKRDELEVGNKYVIGHVGGFTKPKNTKFLIDIMKELKMIDQNVCLLLIGDGPEKKQVEQHVKELRLEKEVIFLGMRNDVNEWLQAMDLFVLPSFFEGLPFVAIEAQMAGLKVIMSDTITKEVILSDKCIFENINNSPSKWAELIFNNLSYSREETTFNENSCSFELEEYKERIQKILLKGE